MDGARFAFSQAPNFQLKIYGGWCSENMQNAVFQKYKTWRVTGAPLCLGPIAKSLRQFFRWSAERGGHWGAREDMNERQLV